MNAATLSRNTAMVKFRLAGGPQPKLDGMVGYNFLRNYKVVIEYPNELLSLFQT